MKEIEIKKIVEISESNLNKITEWMYEWWEKFGWKYISDIDTFSKEQKIQRLYRLVIED